jgi:hypothetical protein
VVVDVEREARLELGAKVKGVEGGRHLDLAVRVHGRAVQQVERAAALEL